MARKSRKNQKYEEPKLIDHMYDTALYSRLSTMNNGKDNQDSIRSQIELMNNFVKTKEELRVKKLYCDNGESGTNFDRPEWERLMEDVRKRKIRCIVVKDLSRLGRNYIEAGDYIDKIFPFLSVRFIAINDHYDSEKVYFKDCDMEVSIKNLVNDYYAKDISQKVLTAFDAKKKRGEFIGPAPPYGYKRDEKCKNHLVPDEEAAKVVTYIFKLKKMGLSDRRVAIMLNEEKIPPPGRYKHEKGEKGFERYKDNLWQSQSVRLITGNQVYLGHMVQNKVNQSIYSKKRKGRCTQEEWLIIKNTHEPMVDEDTFLNIKENNHAAKEEWEKGRAKNEGLHRYENILSGILFCGECGHSLQRRQDILYGTQIGKRLDYYYFCGSVFKYQDVTCKKGTMKDKTLLNLLYQQVMLQIDLVIELESLMKNLQYESKFQNKVFDLETSTMEEKQNYQRFAYLKDQLYQDFKAGLLSKSEYIFTKEKYAKQLTEKETWIKQLEGKRKQESSKNSETSKWMEEYKRFRNEKTLTKEMVNALISRVEFYAGRRIVITFQFKNEFDEVFAFLQGGEVKGGS